MARARARGGCMLCFAMILGLLGEMASIPMVQATQSFCNLLTRKASWKVSVPTRNARAALSLRATSAEVVPQWDKDFDSVTVRFLNQSQELARSLEEKEASRVPQLVKDQALDLAASYKHFTDFADHCRPSMRRKFQKAHKLARRLSDVDYVKRNPGALERNMAKVVRTLSSIEEDLTTLDSQAKKIEQDFKGYNATIVSLQQDVEKRKLGYESNAMWLGAIACAGLTCAFPALVGGGLLLEGVEVGVSTLAAGGCIVNTGGADGCSRLQKALGCQREWIRESRGVIANWMVQVKCMKTPILDSAKDVESASEAAGEGACEEAADTFADVAEDLSQFTGMCD